MSDAKIKVIVKRPDEPIGHVTNIANSLRNLQNTVGGFIEAVYLDAGHVIICNEDGKLQGLPYNLTVDIGRPEQLVGTIIVAGVDGEEFCDISDYMWEKWKKSIKEV